MKTSCYRINTDQANVGEILQWCEGAHQVDRMLLAIRLQCRNGRWRPLSPDQYTRALELFGRFVISEKLVSGWPGNKLRGHPGLVFLVRFDRSVRNIVAEAGPKFCDWVRKDRLVLPEDICLFRAGATHPTLISVTHEGDAWLLTDKRVQMPQIVMATEAELREVSNFIFNGPWFCRKWRGREQRFSGTTSARHASERCA